MSELEVLNVFIRRPHQLAKPLQDKLETLFDEEILPSLTPLGIADYRPSPKLMNKKINIFVDLSNEVGKQTAIVQLPTVIKRFYALSHEGKTYFFLAEDIIKEYVYKLFNGYQID